MTASTNTASTDTASGEKGSVDTESVDTESVDTVAAAGAHATNDGFAPTTANESRRTDRARWWDSHWAQRVSTVILLAGTAGAYLWNLSANKWGNSFYGAAIQAGSQSWKAMFFGSSDMGNSITVDKPPAFLWLPDLSVRIFGLNSWAMLAPEALMGVAAVAITSMTVRRYFGHWTGILAGVVLATTPVAALMFRYNNPEAALVLLMVAAGWAGMRAIENGRTRWMALCGLFVGLGFITKLMAALLIVPGIAVAYLLFGPPGWGKRALGLIAAGAGLLVGAGWWVLAVEFWPADSRPYIGGSTTNSIMQLALGYNGLGRLDGNEHASVPGGGHGSAPGHSMMPPGDMPGGHHGGFGGFGGQPGWLRMFEPAQGGQIAWLLPAAVILGLAIFVIAWRLPSSSAPVADNHCVATDFPARVARGYATMWFGWLGVSAVVFSFMAGIFHSYYTIVLAPAIAALVAAGCALCWRHRFVTWVRLVAAGTVWGTAATAFVLLQRTPDFAPWLRWMVAVFGAIAGIGMLLAGRRRVAVPAAVLALLVGLAGPVAYTLDTVAGAHAGPIVSAGPQSPGQRDAMRPPVRGATAAGGARPTAGVRTPQAASTMFGRNAAPNPAVVQALAADAGKYTWTAATVGSNGAAAMQLASGYAVMPVGGFSGTDPAPTLARFQRLVSARQIHYFVDSGRMGHWGGDDTSSQSAQISSWVKQHFQARTVGDVTMYDLTAPR